MALSDMWSQTPEQLDGKRVNQIIAFAGDGQLRDGRNCSQEFRDFLRLAPARLLETYIDDCLTGPRFENSGAALQDVINEVGRRLGFDVKNGRYRGVQNQIGYDGLWSDGTQHTIVIETKTTDTYTVDLEASTGYRRQLIKAAELTEKDSSVLIVVGRSNTEALEAQIRGSRYAWDVRLISAEALLRLLRVKERIDQPSTVRQICAVLIPKEFTKLDEIIDLVFSTTEDVGEDVEEEATGRPDSEEATTDKSAPVGFHEACIERIQGALNTVLVKQTRTTHLSADATIAVVCSVSRHYESGANYWFGFHPYQQEAIEGAPAAWVCFGCGSPKTIVSIPRDEFLSWLPEMNVTRTETRMYWHISIFEEGGHLVLHRRAGNPRIDLTKFVI